MTSCFSSTRDAIFAIGSGSSGLNLYTESLTNDFQTGGTAPITTTVITGDTFTSPVSMAYSAQAGAIFVLSQEPSGNNKILALFRVTTAGASQQLWALAPTAALSLARVSIGSRGEVLALA
jgi:hypothetical protein